MLRLVNSQQPLRYVDDIDTTYSYSGTGCESMPPGLYLNDYISEIRLGPDTLQARLGTNSRTGGILRRDCSHQRSIAHCTIRILLVHFCLLAPIAPVRALQSLPLRCSACVCAQRIASQALQGRGHLRWRFAPFAMEQYYVSMASICIYCSLTRAPRLVPPAKDTAAVLMCQCL